MDEKKPSKIVLYEMKDDTNTDPLLEDKQTDGHPENNPQPRKKIKTQKYSEEMMTAVRRTGDKVCSKKFLCNRLPILTWITGYTLEMLLCDTIAGVTTALTVIPQVSCQQAVKAVL